ncbi:YihY/virulence factor BrkB family protein [Luedemannella flava]
MRDLIDLGKQVRDAVKRHQLPLVAAGVAFYALLAIFPAALALVAVYGLVTDPDQIDEQLAPITGQLPPGAEDLLSAQLSAIAAASSGGLTLGVVVSLLATLWAAAGGVRALITGLSIVNGQVEVRGFVKRAATSVVLTLGALVTALIVLGLVAAFPVVLRQLGLDAVAEVGAELSRWVLLVVVIGIGLAVLYHWGPVGERPPWRWVTWGTVTALVLWILGSVGFSLYVANFGRYNQMYGSLAGVIILMLWLYLSAFAVLLGAEIDAVRARRGGTGVGSTPTDVASSGVGEQGDPATLATVAIDTVTLWAIWSGIVVLTGIILLLYGIVVVRRDRKRARLAARRSTAEVRPCPGSCPPRRGASRSPPRRPVRRPGCRAPPAGGPYPGEVPRQRGGRPAPAPVLDAPVSAPPDLGAKAPAATTTAAESVGRPQEPPKRRRGGRLTAADCVELRRRCEELRRQAAAAGAAAARAALAAEQAADRRAEAQHERAAAQDRRDAAARETAAALAAASAEAQRLAEQRTGTSEGERVTTHAAFAAFRRGDITADQLREVFRRAEGWTPQQDALTHEVTRCRAAEADAQRTLDFALTTEQVADELAGEAARAAHEQEQAARVAGEQAREACALADECEGGRKRRR